MSTDDNDTRHILTFIQILDSCGRDCFPYSWRGMQGHHCVGVRVGQSDAFRLGFEVACLVERHVAGAEVQQFIDFMMANACPMQESLGRDAVVYFPAMPWPEALAPLTQHDAPDDGY